MISVFEHKFSHLQPQFEAICGNDFFAFTTTAFSLLGSVSHRQYIELIFSILLNFKFRSRGMANIILFQGTVRDGWNDHKSRKCPP